MYTRYLTFRIIFSGLFFLLFSFSAETLSAQGVTLSGTVFDNSDQQPIAGAAVQVQALLAGMYTHENGTYSLTLKRADTILVEVSIAGYEPDSFLLIPGNGIRFQHDFYLNPATLDEVLIETARKGMKQKLEESSFSIDVVKPEQIRLLAATEMSTVLENVPGIAILNGSINIRGSSGYLQGIGSRVVPLLDGLPLLTADGSSAEINMVPLDNVAQVEVIKGASSVLYGSSALGGVINFITREPESKPLTSIRLKSSIYDRPANRALDWDGSSAAYIASGHVFHSRRIGPLDLTLQADVIKNSGYRQASDKEEFRGMIMTRFRPKRIKGLIIGLNMSARIDSSSDIQYWRSYFPDTNLVVNSGGDTLNVVTGGGLTPTLADNGFRKKRLQYYAIDPSVKYLSPKGHLFHYRGRYFRNINDNSANQSSNNFIVYNDFLFSANLLKKLYWINGLTYTYAEANGEITGGKRPGHALGIYSQVDGKVGTRLNLTFGIRYEFTKVDTLAAADSILVRAGANYEIMPGTNVRASFGQAFRNPSVAERYTSTAAGGAIVVPNPNLKPEAGYSVELGIRQGYKVESGLFSALGYVDVAAFLMRYTNMVEFGVVSADFGTGSAIFSTRNVSDARITGIEITTGNNFSWGKNWASGFGGGITLINPIDLNAVPDSLQQDLSCFSLPQLTFACLVEFLDPNKVDRPRTLKYRQRITVRLNAFLEYAKIRLAGNYRYLSFTESIDQSSYLIAPDLLYFREKHPNGYHIVDMTLAYQVTDGSSIAVRVDNALNEEYDIIQGFMGEQRKFTLQYVSRF
jgi:iron complex outermembrane receptor protein